MIYLSQLLGKNVYENNKNIGNLSDLAVVENSNRPPVNVLCVTHRKKKHTFFTQSLLLQNNRIFFQPTDNPATLESNTAHKDLYLSEDLLDKQVIDIDGRRLVRVNDVLLEQTADGKLTVTGIDIGINGILRRLGLGNIKIHQKILPWGLIEAFDYETGSIKIKLNQKGLNSLHPSEIADILEEAGTKERLGIVEDLEPKKAAMAIEEADDQTQLSILEGLTSDTLRTILNKMHISEIADVFHELNPLKIKEIQHLLGTEKTQKVKKLSYFSDNVAGGLMHETFQAVPVTTKVKTLINQLGNQISIPDAILVTHEQGKLAGMLLAKDLLQYDANETVETVITEKQFVFENTGFLDILRVFSQYNLRALPVVDIKKKPIGLIFIDDLLKLIEEANKKDEI